MLRERIDACSSLVVVMSPTAMQSPWVRLEVGRALARGRSVHPILLAGERFDWLAGWQYDRVNDVQVLPPRLLDELRYDLAAPATASVAAGPARLVGRGFPLPNPYFVGRADQLLDLESRLYLGPAMAVQALHGTGGVGKTQLAAHTPTSVATTTISSPGSTQSSPTTYPSSSPNSPNRWAWRCP